MTPEERLKKAIEIIEREGYYFPDDAGGQFVFFPDSGVVHDNVMGFVRLDGRFKHGGNKVRISFAVSLCRLLHRDASTSLYRDVAAYLTHMCDVCDELNALDLVTEHDGK